MPFIKCLLWAINLLTILADRLAGLHFMRFKEDRTFQGSYSLEIVESSKYHFLLALGSAGEAPLMPGQREEWLFALSISQKFLSIILLGSEFSKILKQSWFQTLCKEEWTFYVRGRLPSTLPAFSPLPRGGNCHHLFKSPLSTGSSPERKKGLIPDCW